MEEDGAVALLAQAGGDGRDIIIGVAGEDEGLNKHGYAAEDGGQCVNAFATVGVAVAKGEALCCQRVKERGVTELRIENLELRIVVEVAPELFAKGFED